MLDKLLDAKNFGSFILEITSWENDGDHYQTNIEFEKDPHKALERYDYLTKASNNEPFKVNGKIYKDLQELSDSDDTDPEGFHLSDYILNNIGWQYETSIVRVVESVKIYFLDKDGDLNHVFVYLG